MLWLRHSVLLESFALHTEWWEPGESFTDAVIREVQEETGLHIRSPQLCGIKDWCENQVPAVHESSLKSGNHPKNIPGIRYFHFLFCNGGDGIYSGIQTDGIQGQIEALQIIEPSGPCPTR